MPHTITLPVPGAPDMNVFVAQPETPVPAPVLMLFQEAFGLNHHIREVATRLAGQGFLTVAPELFHRTAPAGFEAAYTNFAQVQPHIQALTTAGIQDDIRAVYDWLQNQDFVQKENIGSIGFCMGGRVSFIANSCLPLKAAVSFYGGGIQNLTGLTANISAPQLFFWGGKDKHILPEHIAAVTASFRENGKTYTNVEFSNADHGFFCNERTAYHPESAHLAWTMTIEFFKGKLL